MSFKTTNTYEQYKNEKYSTFIPQNTKIEEYRGLSQQKTLPTGPFEATARQNVHNALPRGQPSHVDVPLSTPLERFVPQIPSRVPPRAPSIRNEELMSTPKKHEEKKQLPPLDHAATRKMTLGLKDRLELQKHISEKTIAPDLGSGFMPILLQDEAQEISNGNLSLSQQESKFIDEVTPRNQEEIDSLAKLSQQVIVPDKSHLDYSPATMEEK